MRAAIDKAGRIVVPAPLRAKLRLRPGTELELVVEGDTLRLQRRVAGPKLVRVGKRLVARPTVAAKLVPEVDVADLIDAERSRTPW
jgi:AbrB family looped-hinge helix DNA binding protein